MVIRIDPQTILRSFELWILGQPDHKHSNLFQEISFAHVQSWEKLSEVVDEELGSIYYAMQRNWRCCLSLSWSSQIPSLQERCHDCSLCSIRHIVYIPNHGLRVRMSVIISSVQFRASTSSIFVTSFSSVSQSASGKNSRHHFRYNHIQ